MPLLVVHVPPAVVEFNVVVKPTHTANEGLAVITAGLGLIVITVVMIQPVGRVYVMTSVVPLTPPFTPVTTPVEEPTVALPLLALHVPPPGVEFNVVVKPTQTAKPLFAVILVGLGLIDTVAVAIQPVAVSE